MKLFNLCNDDNLLNLLKETFQAFPIKIPEERIKPLVVISSVGKKNKYIGNIENLLTNKKPFNIEIKESKMADLSAAKSKTIETKLGLDILNGFLSGFGVNGSAMNTVFNEVESISFSFENVIRNYIDIAEFSDILTKCKLNEKNPVVKNFIDKKSEFIIIDSIITSNNFSINVDKVKKKDFKFDVSAVEKLLNSSNNLSIKSTNNLNISFQGTEQLAFAFSAFKLNFNEDGSLYLDDEPDEMYLTTIPALDILTERIDFYKEHQRFFEIE